jgi:hypothetical protein
MVKAVVKAVVKAMAPAEPTAVEPATAEADPAGPSASELVASEPAAAGPPAAGPIDRPAAAAWLTAAAITSACRILDSHQRVFERPLIAEPAGGLVPLQRAQALFSSERLVLAHDAADPAADPGPRLIYANRAALRLWRRPWDAMVGMPSRLTAEPGERAERAQALGRAQRLTAIGDYAGIRMDSRGRRFRIEGARLWTLLDERGRPLGQAASFARWWWL